MSHTILLVEDNENDVFLLKRALLKAGSSFALQFAEDGQQALDYLQGTGRFADRIVFPAPDLVLLDLKLPFVMGLDVLQSMRASPRWKLLPVIVFTSSRDPRDIERAYRLGANAYLVKPPSFDQLVEIARALRDFWFQCNHLPPGPGA